MTFNSLAFVIFAACFFGGWAIVRRFAPRAVAWTYLAAASFVFYGWWNWHHLWVLVVIVLASYGSGRLIARFPNRRAVLAAAIVVVLIPLVAFKYLDFATAQVNALARLLDLDIKIGATALTVPLGISFYTLSAISYAIDVYTGEIAPTPSILQHGLYLALFPLLMSGPIVRGAQLVPQLAALPATTTESRWRGLKQITYGLVKKCIIADHIAAFTGAIYELDPIPGSSGLWWCVAVLYLIQVYCDFSGYTDVALGLGRWIGLELPDNFNHPFLASSFRDFWNRWNISFSTWLRDYIYFPLARRWEGIAGAVAAVLVTFFVSGLWHGAASTFVVWGLIHGTLLCLESWSKWDRRIKTLPGGTVIATVLVFLTVALVQVVFRASDLAHAWSIVTTMFSFDTTEYSWFWHNPSTFREPTWLVLPALFVIVEARHLVDFDASRAAAWFRATKLGWIAIAVLLLACVYLRGRTTAFIYAGF
jgi:alginate O-acetyltransferase complex protein AlgI